MIGKQHLRALPEIQVPIDYPRDSTDVSLSLPIFASKKGRNALFGEDSDFDVEAFKKMVVLSSVWAYVSIATNTDLCKNGMPVYFHVEDTIADIAVPILQACGVPDDWIKITHFDSFPHEDKIDEYQVGKKFAYFADETIETEVCVLWDADAHVYQYPGQPIYEWYHRFQTDLKELPMFSFYSDWNGGHESFVNWLLRGVGELEQPFAADDPGREADMKRYEEEAYNAVGLEVPNQQHRWGGAILSVPRKHPLFTFAREHHSTSYADEALITMYMNANPDTQFLELVKEFAPFVLSDDEFIEMQANGIVHLAGDPEKLPKYQAKFLSGIDGRYKNVTVYDTPNASVPSGIRAHILSVPHNPSHKDYSHCAFSQKARKLAYMLNHVGIETYHYGNELSEVQCTEHVTVTTTDDIIETFGEDATRRPDFCLWQPDSYVYKQFFLRAEHQLRKRYQPKDIICYVFGPGLRPIYDNLQDLPDAVHCESGIGYYYPYAPYRVHESPGLMHFNLGIAQAQYDKWASMTEEQKKSQPRNPNTEIHHSWMQWWDAVIPNSFDMEDFDYSETNDDYFLCLGRIMPGKGIEIAMRVAHAMGKKLIVVGQGDFEQAMGFKPWDNVELFGRADVEQRRELYANCIALFALSTYPEPFGGVHVEAALSGKPVISTDIGAYCHTVKHGLTGYRCRLNVFEQALWAARNVDKIDPATCRRWGQRFRNERVALSYQEYFSSVHASLDNNRSPFWLMNPERTHFNWIDDTLDWLNDPIL